jgi:hypothetical protein
MAMATDDSVNVVIFARLTSLVMVYAIRKMALLASAVGN